MDTIISRPDDTWSSRTESLIAELSATLVCVDADDVASTAADALRRLGETLDVDRALLLERVENSVTTETAFEWAQPLAPGNVDGDVALLKTLVELWPPDRDAMLLARIPADLDADVRAAMPGDALSRIAMTSAVVVRVTVPGAEGLVCALALGVCREYFMWPDGVVERLRIVAGLLAGALARRRQEAALHQQQSEIARLRAKLDDGNAHGGPAIAMPRAPVEGFEDIVGDSPALRTALGLLQEVASTDSTALLLGETGTGKELFARALHAHSARRQFPIVCVNCAALPPTLIESELFGHERGAFTDAVAQRQGRFELAHRGTLFLDEIGDLPLELQAKLLRVLQEGEFERIGTSRTKKVDVRIVAATHRDLGRAVVDADFREDLYYRLNVFPIRLPPLRERREDIPALVWATIRKRQRAVRRSIAHVPQSVMDTLMRHEWPGNIRQLENVVERALIHSTGDTLALVSTDLDELPSDTPENETTLSSVERTYIEKVLRECGWRINGAGNTAERLGLHPNTLRFRMKKLGIVRARPAAPPPHRAQ